MAGRRLPPAPTIALSVVMRKTHHMSCVNRVEAASAPSAPDKSMSSAMRETDHIGCFNRVETVSVPSAPTSHVHRKVENASHGPCLKKGRGAVSPLPSIDPRPMQGGNARCKAEIQLHVPRRNSQVMFHVKHYRETFQSLSLFISQAKAFAVRISGFLK